MASHFDPFTEAFALLEDGGWVGGWPRWSRRFEEGGVAQVETPWHMGICALSRLAKNDGPLT